MLRGCWSAVACLGVRWCGIAARASRERGGHRRCLGRQDDTGISGANSPRAITSACLFSARCRLSENEKTRRSGSLGAQSRSQNGWSVDHFLRRRASISAASPAPRRGRVPGRGTSETSSSCSSPSSPSSWSSNSHSDSSELSSSSSSSSSSLESQSSFELSSVEARSSSPKLSSSS